MRPLSVSTRRGRRIKILWALLQDESSVACLTSYLRMHEGMKDFEMPTEEKVELASDGFRLLADPTREGPPKTAAGRRTTSLPSSVTVELARHLERFAGATYVFPSRNGGPLHAADWRTTLWHPAVHTVELSPLRPHDLKHNRSLLLGRCRSGPFRDRATSRPYERGLHLRPLRTPVPRDRSRRRRQARRDPRRRARWTRGGEVIDSPDHRLGHGAKGVAAERLGTVLSPLRQQ